MARNIEIKARLARIDAIEPRVAALASRGPMELSQDDTFFSCPTGRLKLREFSAAEGELIFYRRADQQGPKECFYVRTPTSDPAGLREALRLAYGIIGRVLKRRTLYLIGRTRVHLDRVHALGDFLELEVVLGDAEPAADGMIEADSLMRRLGIDPVSLVPSAYLDLLQGPAQSAQ